MLFIFSSILLQICTSFIINRDEFRFFFVTKVKCERVFIRWHFDASQMWQRSSAAPIEWIAKSFSLWTSDRIFYSVEISIICMCQICTVIKCVCMESPHTSFLWTIHSFRHIFFGNIYFCWFPNFHLFAEKINQPHTHTDKYMHKYVKTMILLVQINNSHISEHWTRHVMTSWLITDVRYLYGNCLRRESIGKYTHTHTDMVCVSVAANHSSNWI